MTPADLLSFVVTTISELTRPPPVRTQSFTSCNCRLNIRRLRLVIGFQLILQPCPLRLPIDDFCSSVRGFAIRFFQLTHHCAHLADSLALPTSGRARDFHPIDCTHAEHTKNRRLTDPRFLMIKSTLQTLKVLHLRNPLTLNVLLFASLYVLNESIL